MTMQGKTMRNLLNVLAAEMQRRQSGGIYHRLQIDFAYNSNHIEGSTLNKDQTRFIFDTQTLGIEAKDQTPVRVNDVIETVNHFRCFDHIIRTAKEPVTESYIKQLHAMLKAGIMSDSDDVVVGDYKKYANEVGGRETVSPKAVSREMQALLGRYDGQEMSLYDIAEFHVDFEHIHPFYDGNGRVGRLLLFKQCLENNVVPFYIDEFAKAFYYKGLQEWQDTGNDERLINVFLSRQDDMEYWLKYFEIDYTRTETTYEEVVEAHEESQ